MNSTLHVLQIQNSEFIIQVHVHVNQQTLVFKVVDPLFTVSKCETE